MHDIRRCVHKKDKNAIFFRRKCPRSQFSAPDKVNRENEAA